MHLELLIKLKNKKFQGINELDSEENYVVLNMEELFKYLESNNLLQNIKHRI